MLSHKTNLQLTICNSNMLNELQKGLEKPPRRTTYGWASRKMQILLATEMIREVNFDRVSGTGGKCARH